MVNRIVIVGRTTNETQLRYTPAGTPVATFTLAVDRPKVKDKEKETDFINVVVWGKQGETCAEYLKKGKLAAVDGRLQIRSYMNNENKKVYVAEVVADSVRFLERKEQNNMDAARNVYGNDDPFAGDGKPVDISDSDLPF